MTIVALIYLTLITAAEVLTILNPWSGLILHSLILVALLFHGATTRPTASRRFLIVLTLAPLIRILSISLPLRNFPLVFWYLIIGGLLFVAALLALRVSGLGARRIGLTVRSWPIEIGIAFLGTLLGWIEYFILYPAPLIPQWTWGNFLLAAFILLVFTGILEEFIFRGLIQEASIGVLGRGGLIYTAFLFAILHVGYLSLSDVLFVFGVGLMFGLIIARTRSLLGISLAHGLTNITLYLVYPFLLGGLVAAPATPSAPPELLSPPLEIPHFRGQYSTPTPTIAIPPAPPPAPLLPPAGSNRQLPPVLSTSEEPSQFLIWPDSCSPTPKSDNPHFFCPRQQTPLPP